MCAGGASTVTAHAACTSTERPAQLRIRPSFTANTACARTLIFPKFWPPRSFFSVHRGSPQEVTLIQQKVSRVTVTATM